MRPMDPRADKPTDDAQPTTIPHECAACGARYHGRGAAVQCCAGTHARDRAQLVLGTHGE